MTPLEMSAIILFALIAIVICQIVILYIYHYYFLVPLFKLMSYQSGVDLSSSLNPVINPPIAKKSTRSALTGQALTDLMDKVNNAF
jgi:hypothetical protein